MSFSERRKKNGFVVPKLDNDSPGYYKGSPFDNENFETEVIRESADYGEFRLRSDGTILFSQAYPVVTLADLKFHEQLGHGVQGTVYRCTHIPSNKEFAVKSIKYQDKSQLQKTVDEIHSLRILRHPNVVNLFSAFFQKGSIHILMDLVKGASLGDYLKYSPIIPEPALHEITVQMIAGLLFCSKNHIIHRDLKPSNVMVSRDGRVQIADFGLARQLRDTGDFTQSVIGTTCYMSPERIRGHAYGLKSDVWSLGLILYQSCIGRYPFGENKTHFWDLNFETQNDLTIDLGPNYSPALLDFISKCLVIDPDGRATFEELNSHEWITAQGGEDTKQELLDWIKNADDRRNIDLDAQRRSRDALFAH